MVHSGSDGHDDGDDSGDNQRKPPIPHKSDDEPSDEGSEEHDSDRDLIADALLNEMRIRSNPRNKLSRTERIEVTDVLPAGSVSAGEEKWARVARLT